MSDTSHVSTVEPESGAGGSYFDWPAIFGGAVVAAAIAVLFTGFGAALGLTTVSAEEGETSGSLPLIVIGAWLLISTMVSYMAGGYIAGRMRRRVESATDEEVQTRDGMHGMVVWALGVLLTGWIAAGIVGSTASAVGNVAQGTASALGSAAQGIASGASAAGESISDMTGNPLELVNSRLMRGTDVNIDETPELPDGGMAILRDVLRTGEIDENDRAYLAEAISENSNISQQDAEARIDQAVNRAVELRQQAMTRVEEAEQAARDAAETARRATILTGFAATAALLLAAAAAVWGSVAGGRHRETGRLFGGFRSF